MKINERDYSDEKRMEYAEKGYALSDGSFPIVDKKDLENAITSYGLGRNKNIAKNHIIKRAKDLNAVDMLPDKWKVNENYYQTFEQFSIPKYNTENIIENNDIRIQDYNNFNSLVRRIFIKRGYKYDLSNTSYSLINVEKTHKYIFKLENYDSSNYIVYCNSIKIADDSITEKVFKSKNKNVNKAVDEFTSFLDKYVK